MSVMSSILEEVVSQGSFLRMRQASRLARAEELDDIPVPAFTPTAKHAKRPQSLLVLLIRAKECLPLDSDGRFVKPPQPPRIKQLTVLVSLQAGSAILILS